MGRVCPAEAPSMKKHPIHQNLSTSFVDLPSLIRHLRDLQFVGSIRVELASYEGEIIFTGSPKLRAREHDRVAGRIAMGEQAFFRILNKARDPYGRIHVYQSEDGRPDEDVLIDEMILASARQTLFDVGDRIVHHFVNGRVLQEGGDRISLLSELVATVDKSLSMSDLNFSVAFANACREASWQFPFLEPEKGLVRYEAGRLQVSWPDNDCELAEAVCEVLTTVFRRLKSEGRLVEAFESARQSVQMLAIRNLKAYERLALSEQVARLLEIE